MKLIPMHNPSRPPAFPMKSSCVMAKSLLMLV